MPHPELSVADLERNSWTPATDPEHYARLVKVDGGVVIANPSDEVGILDSNDVRIDPSTEPTALLIKAALDTLNAKDFATETKLEAVRALLAGTLTISGTVTVSNPTADPETGLAKETTLSSLNSKDFATQTTLALVKTALDTLNSKDFATETKLEAVRALLAGTLTIAGTVSVGNFPADYPLPASQVSDLKIVTGPLTDTQLRAAAVPVSGPLTSAQLTAELLAKEATQQAVRDRGTNFDGTWDYRSGVSGTPSIPVGAKIIQISAVAITIAGTLTINGGSSVPVPATVGLSIAPQGKLVAPTLVFTNTDSYFVEFVV